MVDTKESSSAVESAVESAAESAAESVATTERRLVDLMAALTVVVKVD